VVGVNRSCLLEWSCAHIKALRLSVDHVVGSTCMRASVAEPLDIHLQVSGS
jgi:hypothetical protein